MVYNKSLAYFCVIAKLIKTKTICNFKYGSILIFLIFTNIYNKNFQTILPYIKKKQKETAKHNLNIIAQFNIEVYIPFNK